MKLRPSKPKRLMAAQIASILVNGPNQVYVERFGKLEETGVRFRNDEHVLRVIERLASRVGRRIHPRHRDDGLLARLAALSEQQPEAREITRS